MMVFLYILIALILLYIIFVVAPAVVLYYSIFGRRKVLPPDDPQLNKPAVEPFRERVVGDYHYLLSQKPETVSIDADGVTLCADCYDRGCAQTALMVHGFNADPYVNLGSQARWFYDNGFNLLVIYHRGHGKSGGNRCAMGVAEKEDLKKWIAYLLERSPERNILLYGTSMGGTTVAYLADTIDNERVRCGVVDSGYISPMGQLQMETKQRHLPGKLLLPYMNLLIKKDLKADLSERTTDHLKNARLPLLFIHGTTDPTVPYEQGQKNYAVCASQKQMVTVEGAQHTMSFLTDEEKVTAAYRDLIDTYFT